MTLRSLPEMRAPTLAAEIKMEIPDKAMQSWDRGVTALANDSTIQILDVIGEDWWTGGGVTPQRISQELRSIGPNPVTVQINSPGGIYDDGIAIYNMLRLHPAKVTTQIVGMAASAASIIAMAGDEIQIGKAAHMMIHNTQWVAIGDRHAMKAAFDAMVIFDETSAQLYADRTGNDIEAVRSMLDDTTFFGGAEAVEQGFADGYLPSDQVIKASAALKDRPLAYRIEAGLEKAGWSRTERRNALRELLGSKPGAAAEGMPSAADEAGDGLKMLRLAAARLSLKRA